MSHEPEGKPLDATRPCAHCGRPFLSHVPTAKFCTMVCRRKADRERQTERKRSTTEGRQTCT